MILAFDIGTTALKGGLITPEGMLDARVEVPLQPGNGGAPPGGEADASGWLQALGQAAARLELGRRPRPAAVVVSGNGPTLVAVDAEGRPVAPALTWLDRRSIQESRLISKLYGAYVDPSFYLPKALWILRHRPEVYERTRWFLPSSDFVDFHLTGEARAVLPAPEFTRYMWTEELVRRAGLDADRFPPFIPPAREIGRVRPEAQESLGIPAGVPVISGGPDFIMTLLGTGTVAPGRVCERSGTSEGINLCSRAAVADSRLMCLPHIIGGCWNVSGIISTSGKALEWFRNVAGREGQDYESFLEEARAVPAGSRSLVFLPYLSGERAPLWDPHARGTFVGLSLEHGRAEMTRAVLESVGYAIRDVIEVMEEDGLEVGDLRATGGQARSPFWNQVKADVTGRRILITETRDAELLGGGFLALTALGRFGGLAEAAESMVRIRQVFEPNRALEEPYARLFGIYRDSYRSLKGVFGRLAGLEEGEEE